jgi:hypothetical protein
MYAIYAIGIIMFLMAAISSPAEKANDRIKARTEVKAQQMYIWHQSVRDVCYNTTLCNSSGRIPHSNILNALPEFGQSAPAFTSEQFRSYSDGSVFITVYYPEISGVATGRGFLAAQLIYYVGNEKTAGLYDRANERIGKYDGGFNRVDVPNTVGGLSLPDGISIIGNGL